MHAHVSTDGRQRRPAVTAGIQERQPNPRGEAMVAELKWVHEMIRGDLRIVAQVAADARDGRPGEQVAAGIESLAAAGPLWQLKVNCLQYCRFVHSHHHAESALLFPALRQANPALGPVVDKLEADHASIATLLDQVSAIARELAGQEDTGTRQRLVTALSADLLAHLAYEEENVSATMATMTGWPGW
jgi:hypothetical protein